MIWCSPERDWSKGVNCAWEGKKPPAALGWNQVRSSHDRRGADRFRNNAAFCSMKASSQSQSSCSVHVITRAHPEAGSSSVWPLCWCRCRTSLSVWRGWISIEGRRCHQVSTSHQTSQNGMSGNISPSCFQESGRLYGLKLPPGMRILDCLGR